jgi:hypothetical protein
LSTFLDFPDIPHPSSIYLLYCIVLYCIVCIYIIWINCEWKTWVYVVYESQNHFLIQDLFILSSISSHQPHK